MVHFGLPWGINMKFSNTTYAFYASELLDQYTDLPKDLVDITEEEYSKFLNGDYGSTVSYDESTQKLITRSVVVEKTDAEKLAIFLKSVSESVDYVSSVGLQCYMAGIDFPADWKAYRTALITLSKTTEYSDTLVLPPQPDLPSNI